MPKRTSRPARRPRRKPARGKRARKSSKRLDANRMDRATVVETQEIEAVPEGGNFVSHSLSQYARALNVSRNFRMYRCKKVELEFVPFANVFASGTAFPELYFQVDRTQGVLPAANLPLPTKNMMLARGCMPQKWTSIIRKTYNPSVLRLENLYQNIEPGAGSLSSIGASTSTPVFNKWYATQGYNPTFPPGGAYPVTGLYAPAALVYYGATYMVNQELASPEAVLGTIKIRVHWEFKEPLWITDNA